MKFINHQHHHDKLLSLYYNNVSQVQGFSLQSDSLLVTTKDKNLWVSTIFQCTLSWEEEETSRLGSNSSLSDRTIYGHGGGGGSTCSWAESSRWRGLQKHHGFYPCQNGLVQTARTYCAHLFRANVGIRKNREIHTMQYLISVF